MDKEVKEYIEMLDKETQMYIELGCGKKLLLQGYYSKSPFLRSIMRKAAKFGIKFMCSRYVCEQVGFDGVIVCHETFDHDITIPADKDIDSENFPCVTEAIALLLTAYNVKRNNRVVVLGTGRSVKPLDTLFMINGINYQYVDTRYDDVLKATTGADALIIAAPLYPRCQLAHDTKKVVIDVTDAIEKTELWGCPVVQHIGPLTVSILFNRLVCE